ncbi:MAG: NAD(P)-dependent oxidoreductase [Patescibacteria group bacterium]
MIISFFEIEEWEKELLQQTLAVHTLVFSKHKLTQETLNVAKEAEIISTFIYSQLSDDILFQRPHLKLIATRSTGYDHIDLSYCRKHSIAVSNVPVYGVHTIAEHTFALILALSRKIIPSVEKTRRGDFTLGGLRGFELANKTLGLVGLGHIGKRVAQIARGFRMNVIATTRHPDPHLAEQLGITFVDLLTLLKTSDVVSLHVPLTSETRHLISKKNIGLMKKGSLLVNTSRGAIVETEAILWSLEQGILMGAGLDVLEEERALKEERELITQEFLKTCDLKTQLLNHVLLTNQNVIITPHNAFNSQEALTEILTTTTDTINAWISHSPTNIVG